MKLLVFVLLLCNPNVKAQFRTEQGKSVKLTLQKYDTAQSQNEMNDDVDPLQKLLNLDDRKRQLASKQIVQDIGNMETYQYMIPMYVGKSKKLMTFMIDTGLALTWISVAERKKCKHVIDEYCGSFNVKESRTYKKSRSKETIYYGDKELKGVYSTDNISLDEKGKVLAKKATFVSISGGDFESLDFLQTNSVLGLGPIRKKKKNEKHFVQALQKSKVIKDLIYGIYLSPQDDIKSQIIFGATDEAIALESKAQYGTDISYLKIISDRKWTVDLLKVKIGDVEVIQTAKTIFFDTAAQINYITKRSLDQLLRNIQETKTCEIDSNRENIHCQCSSVDDPGFPDI